VVAGKEKTHTHTKLKLMKGYRTISAHDEFEFGGEGCTRASLFLEK
jgi:hypothetical protein